MMNSPEESPRPKKLLEQVTDRLRLKHYSRRTEEAYLAWIRRYILFHQKRHPRDLGVPEIEAFLTDLAVHHHVAASTQNQALCALIFLYREVLLIDLPGIIDAVRAKKPKRLPTVLTATEVRQDRADGGNAPPHCPNAIWQRLTSARMSPHAGQRY